MEKALTIKISEEEHRNIKVLSAEEGKTIKDFLLFLVKDYKENKDSLYKLLPIELNNEVKHLSIDYNLSTKDFCINALNSYIQELKKDKDMVKEKK